MDIKKSIIYERASRRKETRKRGEKSLTFGAFGESGDGRGREQQNRRPIKAERHPDILERKGLLVLTNRQHPREGISIKI